MMQGFLFCFFHFYKAVLLPLAHHSDDTVLVMGAGGEGGRGKGREFYLVICSSLNKGGIEKDTSYSWTTRKLHKGCVERHVFSDWKCYH